METRSSVGPWRAASMALGVFLLLCIASGRVDAQAPATEEDYPVMYEEWEAKAVSYTHLTLPTKQMV